MADFNCEDINGLSVSQFVFNEDGTVSGIVSTGSTTNDPQTNPTQTTYPQTRGAFTRSEGTTLSPISETCCNALNFLWDNSTNTCYWSETCEQGPDFKITLGAKGNDGAWFQIDENESCHLEVEFDYLFQFDCDTLMGCLQEEVQGDTGVGDLENIINERQNDINRINETITELKDQITKQEEFCQNSEINYNTQLNEKQIECDKYLKNIDNFDALIRNSQGREEIASYEAQKQVYTTMYDRCRSEIRLLQEEVFKSQSDCDNQLKILNSSISKYEDTLSSTQEELAIFNGRLEELASRANPTREGVANCLSIFSGLSVCVTLDKIGMRDSDEHTSYENPTTLTTVFEEQLYQVTDIVDYFSNNCNTGLLVTGDTRCMEQLEQCIIYNLSGDCGVYSACTLDSDWLHHKFTITDEETLSGITNEKVKLGFVIKNCECDFSILIDRIEINKVCTTTDREDIYVSKCPSFEIERVCDNKKSWVAEEEKQDRDFFFPTRETDYDINHHKLAVNTKEVDLDVSPANAIETDIWCYITDNETLLDCSTGTTSITCSTAYDFGSILSAQTLSCDSGYTDTCSVISNWGIEVTLDCKTIYSNNTFYSGTTITDAPTEVDYILELSGIATTLGLEFTSGATGVIFTDYVDCTGIRFINNNFKVDLTLDITTDCTVSTKQFQDNEIFTFQNGTNYDFN